MIRQDPDRPGVYVVDVSSELLLELREGWSKPVQVMIEDDELVMRSLVEVDVVDEGIRSKAYRIPASRGAEADSS